MKTWTGKEADAGLGRGVERALAGDQIRQGDAVVELRPARPDHHAGAAPRRRQEEARLMPDQAEP